MPPTDTAYRPDIDGLRAVAVLSVVVFHLFPTWAPGGFVGVDIFFVISGFLISTILLTTQQRGTFTLREFYARRVRRIFPALALVLAACLAAGYFLLLNDELQPLGTHVLGGAGFVSNVVLWREAGYFDTASELKPLLHLWSLGIEEQFYLVWPALLWIAWRFRANRFVLIVTVLLLSFVTALMQVRVDRVAAFYSPLTRFFELMIGGALAYWHVSGRLRPGARSGWRTAAAVAGVAIIAAAVWGLRRDVTFPGWLALLPTVGAALLIASGTDTVVHRHLLANRAMVWVGLISYPLYLWHWPLAAFARIVHPEWLTSTGRALIVLVSVVLASATYLLIERPIRRRRMSPWPIALVMVMVAAAGLAASRINPRAMSTRYTLPNLATRLLLKNPHNFTNAESCLATDFAGVDAAVRPDKCARQAETPAIVLIGDSHAGQYYAGLQSLGASSIVVWNGGCPPMHGFTVENKQCDARWTVIERFVDTQRAQSPVVLITAFYSSYLYPTVLNGTRSSDYLPFSQTIDPATLPQRFAGALADSVKALRAKGFRVGVLLDGPDYPSAASTCLAASGDACIVERRLVDERQAVVRDAMAALSSADGGVKVFDPVSLLCNATTCSQFIGGALGYWDDNHWNMRGSTWMGERLLAWVQASFGVDARARH